MLITCIADHPELIKTIGQWHWQEWGHADPEGSLESWTQGLALRVNRNRIPTTYVALSETGDLLGSVTLVDNDMHTRPELEPWLAGLYVKPESRGQGIATALVLTAMAEARRFGVDVLYLYTSTAESLYTRLGWQVVDQADYEGDEVVVMSTKLC